MPRASALLPIQLLCLPATAATPAPSCAEAERLAASGRWSEAEKVFAAHAARHPRPGDAGHALLRAADCQEARGDMGKASATLSRLARDTDVLRGEPDAVASAWSRLHLRALRAGTSPSARLRILSEARGRLPRHPVVLRLCEREADAQLAEGATAKAVELYLAAGSLLSPAGTSVLGLLQSCSGAMPPPPSAVELQSLRDIFAAKPACSESLASILASRRRDGWVALDALARWRLGHGDPAGARALWESLLRSRRGPPDLLALSRAEATAASTPREGLAAFDAWLASHPTSSLRPRAEILRASHLLSRADFAAARNAAERFLADRPSDPLCAEAVRIRDRATEAIEMSKRSETILAEQRRRLDADPDLAAIQQAEAFLAEERLSEAEPVFRRIAERSGSPHRARAALGLGRTLRARGEVAAAKKTWEALWRRRASLAPGDAPYAALARRCMADALLEDDGDPARARAAYDEADAFSAPDLLREPPGRIVLRVSALALLGDVGAARLLVERRRSAALAGGAEAHRWESLGRRLAAGSLGAPGGVESPALRAARFRLAQADAQLAVGDARRALRTFRAVGAVRDAAALSDRADFGAAMAQMALGRARNAADALLGFPKRHRTSPLAPLALLNAGALLASPPLNDDRRAAKAFADLARAYPKAPEAEAADFYAATIAWRARRWDEARRLHEDFLRNHPGSRLAPMVRDSRLPAIAARSAALRDGGHYTKRESVTVSPHSTIRHAFRLAVNVPYDGTLEIFPPSRYRIKWSRIVRQAPDATSPLVWSGPSPASSSRHVYQLSSAYSSQEFLHVERELIPPPGDPGPPPDFTAVVPSVNIDWEGKTRWEDEQAEANSCELLPLSPNAGDWKRVVIQNPFSRDVVSPDLTISWDPADALLLKRQDGRSVPNGATIHADHESFPLSLTVVPLATNQMVAIVLEGSPDSAGNRPVDNLLATIYSVRLFVNGEDKTDRETTVVAGQNVVAEVRLFPEFDAFARPILSGETPCSWSIPGAQDFFDPWVIRDYQPTVRQAEVERLSEEDYRKSSVSMYWLDRKNRDPIACSVSAGGKTVTARTYVSATKPDSTFHSELTSHQPKVNIFFNDLSFGYYDYYNNVLSPGITFLPTVTTHENQQGKMCLFQLINIETEYIAEEIYRIASNGYILDSSSGILQNSYVVPYENAVVPLDNNQTRDLTNNGSPLNDSPASRLDDNYDRIERSDLFKTYLMYKPSGQNSTWIPLRMLQWRWQGKATKNETGWILDFGLAPQYPPTGDVCVTPPDWNNHFHRL